MAVQNFQVTLGAASTPILANGDILAKWVIFQNNAAHSMRLGATVTSSKGLLLNSGGAFNAIPTAPVAFTKLKYWNVIGTQNDVLDVIYEDGV